MKQLRRGIVGFIIVLVVGIMAHGCGGDDNTTPVVTNPGRGVCVICNDNSQCQSGLACRNAQFPNGVLSVCISPTTTNCPTAIPASHSVAVFDLDECSLCIGNTDCSEGLACVPFNDDVKRCSSKNTSCMNGPSPGVVILPKPQP